MACNGRVNITYLKRVIPSDMVSFLERFGPRGEQPIECDFLAMSHGLHAVARAHEKMKGDRYLMRAFETRMVDGLHTLAKMMREHNHVLWIGVQQVYELAGHRVKHLYGNGEYVESRSVPIMVTTSSFYTRLMGLDAISHRGHMASLF